MNLSRLSILIALLALFTTGAVAQGTQVPFGGLQQDTTLPVEIAADQLQINQNDGTILFTGNVIVSQGEMRLTAAKVLAEYSGGDGSATGKITKIIATGGVTLVNGTEAAEAEKAEYTIDDGIIIMTGKVVLTQGQNALAAERMVVDLKKGIANMQGRVRTIIQPNSTQPESKGKTSAAPTAPATTGGN